MIGKPTSEIATVFELLSFATLSAMVLALLMSLV
jgi:hypothetical protein